MPQERLFALEVLKTDYPFVEIGFVPFELEEWDYTDPRSGVLRVKIMPNGRAAYTALEGCAEEIIKSFGESRRMVLTREAKRLALEALS